MGGDAPRGDGDAAASEADKKTMAALQKRIQQVKDMGPDMRGLLCAAMGGP